MKSVSISKIRDFLFLHSCILVYTITTVVSKFTSRFNFLSFDYIICFAIIFLTLGIYAVLWQQAIKRFDASVAYSNKSVTIIWTLIFSALIFGEKITVYNIIGAIIIISGIVLVAQND